ncbi:hypothetical protein DACRYDRAFT_40654, partial [Dacryopinax primogenitus]
AQSAHYFKYPDAWREIGRVLRPGGTVAFWSYPTLMLPEGKRFSDLNEKLLRFLLGTGPNRIGQYWNPTAREILWSHFTKLPPP